MQTPKQQLNQPKKGPNPQNFKIVKCKYWEKGISFFFKYFQSIYFIQDL